MKLKLRIIILFFSIFNFTNQENAEILLKGTMISSDESSSIIKYAFDSNLKTNFISKSESNGWVGQNFRKLNVITRIEWGQSDEDHNNYLLGIFEGANKQTFEDAFPLTMITSPGAINEMNNIIIYLRRPFQYVRYVGPHGKYCKISNIRIYGYESSVAEFPTSYYKPTDLPLMIIHTTSGQDPKNKNEKLQSYFYLINNDDVEIQGSGLFRLRGNESIKYEKKPYNIKFTDVVQPLDFKVKSRKWALMPNYGDKTLVRNLLAFEISKIFEMEYTPECKPIDLMLNGEYKGLYNLCEYIDVLENQVDIKALSRNDIKEPKVSGGYLLEANGFAYLGTNFFNTRKGVPVSIDYPDEDDIALEQIKYIKEKFDVLEDSIYSNNLTNVDHESFIKYFLIEELIGNAEAYWSTYIYKNRSDDKFYFGPIWDNELGFDNDYRVYPINCKKKYIFNYGLSAGTMEKLVSKIVQNEEIINKTKEIWAEITQDKLNKDYLSKFIDSKVELIKEAKKYNFMRWDILNKTVCFNPKIYSSYEEEINYLKNFIENRINWLNFHILNITTDDNNIVCEEPPEKDTEKELKYDIDYENDDIDYQLLSDSNNFLRISIFNALINIIFILFN